MAPRLKYLKTAAILAGGMGTRLRAVSGETPKSLMPVAGKPFVKHLLEQLHEAGIRKAVLCTGFGAEKVRSVLGASFASSRGLDARAPMQLECSSETALLGTGGALRLALPLFDSDWVLVMNGDSYAEVELGDFWHWHQRNGARASVVVSPKPHIFDDEGVAHTSPGQRPGSSRKRILSPERAARLQQHPGQVPGSRYGNIVADDHGEVVSFMEKPSEGKPTRSMLNRLISEACARVSEGEGEAQVVCGNLRYWVNAGVYILSRTIIEQIPSGRAISLEREILPGLVGKGFFCYTKCRRFLDIGTPDSYAQAEQFFAHKRRQP